MRYFFIKDTAFLFKTQLSNEKKLPSSSSNGSNYFN